MKPDLTDVHTHCPCPPQPVCKSPALGAVLLGSGFIVRSQCPALVWLILFIVSLLGWKAGCGARQWSGSEGKEWRSLPGEAPSCSLKQQKLKSATEV